MLSRTTLAIALLGAALFVACGTSDGGSTDPAPTDVVAPDDATPTDVAAPDDAAPTADALPPDAGADAAAFDELPVVASEGFLARRAEYLAACNAGNAPGSGGIYGQTCRVAAGETTFHDAAIEEACARLDARVDTADFRLAALVRLLYLDRDASVLPEALGTRIEGAVLGFKYWLDEPGDDKMCYWSENHQILFHSGELLVGQLYPERVFPNAGLTGAQHVAHAEARIERWLDHRARFGFSEWHSNVYYNEDIPALLNLVDFAESPRLRAKAAMVLDLVALDLLVNTYRGRLATTHGRTYPNKLLNGLTDSTEEWAWIVLGLGAYDDTGNFSAAFQATSTYVPPPLLEGLAAATRETFESRQRDGVDVAEGPAWGIGYETPDDVVFWAGCGALVAPEVIDGTAALLDLYGLWDGFLFGDLPDSILALLQNAVGTPNLRKLAVDLEPISRGIALEAASTYTYRTPDYQLSGAQDYHPMFYTAQTHAWQATLDDKAFVFTTFPSDLEMDAGDDVEFGGAWIGSWQPRTALHRNVGVIRYAPRSVPMADPFLTSTYLHAYVPREGFDELREEGGWFFGRKGDGYLALWSERPLRWSDENAYEAIVDATDNVWVVELGRATDDGTFDAFVAAVAGAAVEVTADAVRYDSPSLGRVEVGWEGPLVVDGAPVDLGPYARWDNAHVRQEVGDLRVVVEHEEERLELDFEAATRRVLRRRP